MKYIVMLGDGMADYPNDALGKKTVLEAASTPNMDYLAQNGAVGLAKTVPDGMSPGSDTANLSVMGYDPKVYYTGRSPLEAVSIGIDLEPSDVTSAAILSHCLIRIIMRTPKWSTTRQERYQHRKQASS